MDTAALAKIRGWLQEVRASAVVIFDPHVAEAPDGCPVVVAWKWWSILPRDDMGKVVKMMVCALLEEADEYEEEYPRIVLVCPGSEEEPLSNAWVSALRASLGPKAFPVLSCSLEERDALKASLEVPQPAA